MLKRKNEKRDPMLEMSKSVNSTASTLVNVLDELKTNDKKRDNRMERLESMNEKFKTLKF